MATTERRPPLAGLLHSDGSVVVPPEQAREVLRILVVGIEVLVRANGGQLSAPARRLLYALHDASTHPGASGSGSDSRAHVTVGEVSVGEAAAVLGCSDRRVRQLILAGLLTARRAGARVWLIDPNSLDAYRFGEPHDEDQQ